MEPGVNFTNTLRAAFVPIFYRQKVQTYNVITKKAVRKMLVKLTFQSLILLISVADFSGLSLI